MILLLLSFLAGLLTIFAPCMIPVLPVLLGSGLSSEANSSVRKFSPYVIIVSLAVSIFVFTFALKGSIFFIDINPKFWSYLSGVVIAIFGLSFAFPQWWNKIGFIETIFSKFSKSASEGKVKNNYLGDVIVGASLGPIFTSCSPTYFLILGTVLPVSLNLALIYMFFYVLGLALVMFLVVKFGRKFLSKFSFLANPDGWFRKGFGYLMILIGIAIFSGADKQVEGWLVSNGYLGSTQMEMLINNLLR